MKHVKIRQGVWETNSSSSHSLSIANAKKPFIMDTSLLPDQNGIVFLTGGEFGWNWNKFNDAETKANYLAVFCLDSPDLKKRLTSVIQKQTGCKEVVFKFGKDHSDANWSYIDHQAIEDGTPQGAFKTDAKLRNFIFNRNSWLFTGNDNSTPASDFHDVPVFDTNKVINPVYTFEVVVDGLAPHSVKFKKKPTKRDVEEAVRFILGHAEYIGHPNSDRGFFNNDSDIVSRMMRGDDNVYELGYSFKGEFFDHKNGKVALGRRHLSTIAQQIYNAENKGEERDYNKLQAIESRLIKSGDNRYVRYVDFKVKPVV